MGKLMLIVAIEIALPSCEHLRRIRFPLDDGKLPICYRSRVSYNWFIDSRRNYKPNYKNALMLYSLNREGEMSSPDDISTVDVGNIWEFYKLIGYDYKRQRWDD